jgi:uncharacterized protein YqhQ
MKRKDKPTFKTKIGGQALIEGIMMRGVGKAAMAVRKKDGGIHTEEWSIKAAKWYQKVPFVRGIFNFILQMADGYKYIGKSADLSGMAEEENENPSKFEKWLDDKFGDKIINFITVIAMVLGIGLAIVLFMFLPAWIYSGVSLLFGDTDISAFRSLFEGILKIAIFIGYMWLTSLMKDIRRTYEYHGAEHKTIAAYEAGDPLEPEYIRKRTRFHPRCGTSFIFLVLAISILFYSVVPINSEMFVDWLHVSQFVGDALRVVCKLLLLPVVVGISYEIIRLAGRHDNILTRIVSAPGLWMQRLTTREPDDSQIEIAVAALKPVLPDNKGEDVW